MGTRLDEVLVAATRVSPIATSSGVPRNSALSRWFLCAEEDSNLHPLSVDQALNLVTRVSYPSSSSIASSTSADLDAMDGMDATDDLDVARDVATGFVVREGRLVPVAVERAAASRAKRNAYPPLASALSHGKEQPRRRGVVAQSVHALPYVYRVAGFAATRRRVLGSPRFGRRWPVEL
jgi:hypothetical protein